jgi:hypothetical protein
MFYLGIGISWISVSVKVLMSVSTLLSVLVWVLVLVFGMLYVGLASSDAGNPELSKQGKLKQERVSTRVELFPGFKFTVKWQIK